MLSDSKVEEVGRYIPAVRSMRQLQRRFNYKDEVRQVSYFVCALPLRSSAPSAVISVSRSLPQRAQRIAEDIVKFFIDLML